MHDFRYVKNELYCEDLPVKALAESYGTPLYIYSYKTLIGHFRKLQAAFGDISPLICFSMKANSNSAICRALVKEGAGLDVVSGGELYKALAVGASPRKIVYASVGKTRDEIRDAIKAGILFFNVESLPELEVIDSVSGELRRKVDVCIRVNPDVSAHTHKFITTGKARDKFGLDFDSAKEVILSAGKFSNLKISGLHIHIGSQITQPYPFARAISKAASFIKKLQSSGVRLEYLNIGGGLGIVYKDERPQTAAKFSRAILPLLEALKVKVILEPGRFIVGNAGILVAAVTYVKSTKFKNFVIVDAGMNDLIRPALYGAYHEILPVTSYKGQGIRDCIKADVVGPICESSDFLGKDRKLPRLAQGNYLAIMGAGAYGFSMSSNYNSRCRAAEVLVNGKRAYLVRRREEYKDLTRGESIPPFLR